MCGRIIRNAAWVLVAAGVFLGFWSSQAQAVPSLARQTGMNCYACHTVWPQLTPFGRIFKLTGYTQSKHADKQYEWPPPIAGMAQLSFTHTDNKMPNSVVPPHEHGNDNWDIPQALSVFYAGRIYGPLGMFAQGTYDGIGRVFFLDNTDIRLAKTYSLFSKDIIVGATLNNNPTVQDVLNTTPAWGWPFASSGVALTPTAATLIEGGLGQVAAGGGVYAYWNNLVYLEATLYGTAVNGPMVWMGMGAPNTPDSPAPLVDGVAPYWRLFVNKQWGKHVVDVGTFGLLARVLPSGQTRGASDRFVDLGFDAQYQFIGKKHLVSARTTWIHEWQDWAGSNAPAIGATLNRYNWLDSYKLNASYHYRTDSYGTFGGTFGYFAVSGSNDPVLYAPAEGSGSSSGYPTSDGFIFELEYLPWQPYDRAKLSLQYVLYNHFNGARTNYDVSPLGRNAPANNTLYLLFWLAL